MRTNKPNKNAAAISGVMGNVLERYKYDGFGRRTVLDSSAVVEKTSSEYNWNRAFTGQVLDNETGMMLYRIRYYNTALERFVSRDPVGYSSMLNLYGIPYPISTVDSLGLSYSNPTPREKSCINDCYAGCNKEYGWYNPQRFVCRNYCPYTCTNTPDMLDNFCNDVSVILNDPTYKCFISKCLIQWGQSSKSTI
jgi:RHS repeat-associated protein